MLLCNPDCSAVVTIPEILLDFRICVLHIYNTLAYIYIFWFSPGAKPTLHIIRDCRNGTSICNQHYSYTRGQTMAVAHAKYIHTYINLYIYILLHLHRHHINIYIYIWRIRRDFVEFSAVSATSRQWAQIGARAAASNPTLLAPRARMTVVQHKLPQIILVYIYKYILIYVHMFIHLYIWICICIDIWI